MALAKREVGITHTQYSLNPDGNKDAIQRGKSLLRKNGNISEPAATHGWAWVQSMKSRAYTIGACLIVINLIRSIPDHLEDAVGSPEDPS